MFWIIPVATTIFHASTVHLHTWRRLNGLQSIRLGHINEFERTTQMKMHTFPNLISFNMPAMCLHYLAATVMQMNPQNAHDLVSANHSGAAHARTHTFECAKPEGGFFLQFRADGVASIRNRRNAFLPRRSSLLFNNRLSNHKHLTPCCCRCV